MVDVFNPFKNDEVVGVVSPDVAVATLDAVRAAGFDVELVSEPSKVDADAQNEDGGLFDSILRFFQQGEAKDTLQRFEQRLSRGDNVVRILAVGDRAQEAGQILVDHDADLIWHFGSWTFGPLDVS